MLPAEPSRSVGVDEEDQCALWARPAQGAMTSARVAAAAAAASMADADPALARISVPAWPGACRTCGCQFTVALPISSTLPADPFDHIGDDGGFREKARLVKAVRS